MRIREARAQSVSSYWIAVKGAVLRIVARLVCFYEHIRDRVQAMFAAVEVLNRI